MNEELITIEEFKDELISSVVNNFIRHYKDNQEQNKSDFPEKLTYNEWAGMLDSYIRFINL